MLEKLILAVDMGGSKTAFGLMNKEGNFIHKESLPTPLNHEKSLLNFIIKHSREILKHKGNPPLAGIGISAGGVVNPETQTITHATPLLPGWVGTPVSELLQKEFHVPVKLDNDGNMAALGEYLFGAGKGAKNLVFIALGTGIGGGAIIHGKVYKGKQGAAMNIGHMCVEKNGKPCNCGKKGCMEAYASGKAIEKAYAAKKGDSKQNMISAKEVFHLATKGDDIALEIINNSLDYLALGITNIVELLDPELIVLGGGVSESVDALVENIRKKVQCSTDLFDPKNILISSLGANACLYGAGGSLIYNK